MNNKELDEILENTAPKTRVEELEKENELSNKYGAVYFHLLEVIGKLREEKEQLKKNAIIWHKQDVDDIYDAINDWGLHKYLCRMKDGSFNIATGNADESCSGDVGRYIFFDFKDENYYSNDIEAWAELPEVEE